MKRKEFEQKKAELIKRFKNAKDEELEEIRKEVEELEKIDIEEDDDVDERSLLNGAIERLEKRKVNLNEVKIIKKEEGEERKMTRAEILASKEYRSAWAKKTMGFSDDKLSDEEKRALGDAITTTDTTFVASDTDTQGINNGGLFIPSTVREELMELIEKQSPIYRDVRKLQVSGNIDLPYLFESDDAEWYTETTETKNEGMEFKNLQLTGWELAKDIVITWKLEEMAVESFISFIEEELANKMGRALVNAIIYGDGANKPTGITKGATAIKTGDSPIDCIIDTYKSLDEEERIGAKAYISTNVNITIVGYKDNNGNYPFLQGLSATKLVTIEVDPYLKNNDIIVGNCRKYILNEVTPVRVDKEKTIKGRKVIYGGYGVFDGKPKPGAFAYGQYTPTEKATVPSV